MVDDFNFLRFRLSAPSWAMISESPYPAHASDRLLTDDSLIRRIRPLVAQALAQHGAWQQLKVQGGSGRALGRSYQVKLWPNLVFFARWPRSGPRGADQKPGRPAGIWARTAMSLRLSRGLNGVCQSPSSWAKFSKICSNTCRVVCRSCSLMLTRLFKLVLIAKGISACSSARPWGVKKT
jgi:hypothetical protein